jgi:hypothetical protein
MILPSCVLAFLLLVAQDEKKVPVPDASAQKAAEKLIKEVFKDEYAKKSSEDKTALAKKLLEQAAQTKDDAASHFVMLREARDLATAAGDVVTAIKAIDETEIRYETDAQTLKLAVYSTASKNAKTPEESVALARLFLKVAEDAIAADRYETADKALTEASTLARRGKEVALIARVDAKKKEILDRKSRFERTRKAKEVLEKNPGDPAANLAVGLHECFTRGDWDTGLPLLAKGSDEPLKALASRDLAAPRDAPGQTAVGDGWWDLSEKESNPAIKLNQRARALRWYEESVQGSTGLTKAKIEKRVGELRMDRLRGNWVDVTDPRQFGLPGKAGEPIIVAASKDNPKKAMLEKFPAGEYDGVSVRFRFGTPRESIGLLAFEGARRCVYIATGSNSAAICHSDSNVWTPDKTFQVAPKEEYVLSVVVTNGEYVVFIDGIEVGRVRTDLSRLMSLSLDADRAPATFDQFRLRKKE